MKDEAALLSAARKLDKDAWVEIFNIYAPAIYRYVLGLCHDAIEADRVVGDVFAQLLEQFAAGNGPTVNLRSYIYQTAYHLVVDCARHNQRLRPLEIVENTTSGAITKSTQTCVEERALMDALLFALKNQLTETQRHVIILRFLEEFSLRETAAIIGKDVKNIKVIQNRAIAKLRKCLGVWRANRECYCSPED